ncbi:MAG: ribonuclease HII [Bacteroidales bacterium]|nr:ribonuclease HII [Bacteroidales bacterium]
MLKNYFLGNCIEAGCDEAGRGCLAGPVVAAAVILPPAYCNEVLNDSKKLSEKTRRELRVEIESTALSWAVAFVDNREIDRLNILKASIIAMHRALDKLTTLPQHIIVDGNKFYNYKNIPYTCVVKGDSKFMSIAAASVLAKTHRDEYMFGASKKFAGYNWEHNKGYPTKDHREAIVKLGVCELHRKSFRLLNEQMAIDFN